MGDLAADTAPREVEPGRYVVDLNRDWEIWGPAGGYVAACALRAAGAATNHPRPVALSCHYLNVARWAPVELRVEPLKVGRGASSHRVEMTQNGRPILQAMVWSAGAGEGLEHDETTPPAVPGPDELRSIAELMPAGSRAPMAFWHNIDAKPVDVGAGWPPTGPQPARWRQWLRFIPTPTFDDLWVDAARAVVLIDVASWPAVMSRHGWERPPYVAPTLDLNVAFHRPGLQDEWLLCDGAAPVSTAGLFGWTASVWSTDRLLLASGGGQCLYRRTGG